MEPVILVPQETKRLMTERLTTERLMTEFPGKFSSDDTGNVLVKGLSREKRGFLRRYEIVNLGLGLGLENFNDMTGRAGARARARGGNGW